MEPATQAMILVKKICPLLHGQGAEVQSAALADLVAMWLSGMFIVGDPKKTAQLRAQHLELFVDAVMGLIPINEAMITKPILDRMKQ